MNINAKDQVAHTSAHTADVRRIALSIAAVAAALVVLIACWGSVVPAAHAESLATAVSAADRTALTAAPVVTTADGTVRGVATAAGVQFRGIPYAAPPVGALRWTAPHAVAPWSDTLDATVFPPVCPQLPPSPWGQSEDCLYLNVTAPAGATASAGTLPVIVYIHGGGFSYGEGADYDATKLASDGAIVVTLNYRIGLLGFLAHPALAGTANGSTGNFGYQDQQAALRWVQQNIRQFGGDKQNVTIVGHSAGGLSVLAQLASPGAKGLFDRAVIQAGSFALKQQTLAQAEAAGRASATALGCADQSAECLRSVPVDALVTNAQASFTPGYVDGAVLKESVGTAISSGRFNQVPIINGTNTQEERIFTTIGASVVKGATIGLQSLDIDASSYVPTIATNFGISKAKASIIAAAYPLSKYATPAHAFATLNSDANFSCPAYALDIAASRHVPTFAYEFNDALAPQRDVTDGLGAPFAATHQSELQYLFDLPNSNLPGGLSADQEALATNMRAAWVQFAASGAPSTPAVSWPAFQALNPRILSFQTPASHVEKDFALTHKCGFWAAAALFGTL